MKRVREIEIALRDSILVSLSIEYEYYSELLKQGNSVNMKFIRFDEEIIELQLLNVLEADFCDDYSGVCVSHIKALSQNDRITLSLDPYDERVDAIEQKDNFVLTAKQYYINVSQV
ncbi:hypothetical protein ACJJIP_16510 [Microbulbifer sp. VTAC004]|uniref:hypothetical protein n=1 Tax=Microbulbifer sp. VTAC004 TaxID=3243386 RepID=UPI004039E231